MSDIGARFGDAIHGFYRYIDNSSDVAIAYFNDIDRASDSRAPHAFHGRAVELHRDVCALLLYAQVNSERAEEAAREGHGGVAMHVATRVFDAGLRISDGTAEIARIRAAVLGTDAAWADADTVSADADIIAEFVAELTDGDRDPSPPPQGETGGPPAASATPPDEDEERPS